MLVCVCSFLTLSIDFWDVAELLLCLLQGFQLPQFNETFMANLQGLKSHINESEWQVQLDTHNHTHTLTRNPLKLELNI